MTMYVALRFISLILIASGLMFLGADLITSLEKHGGWSLRSIDQIWVLFSKSSEAGFNAWMQHSLPAPVGRWIASMLSVPAFAFTGVLGVVLAILFGRRAADGI
jgi:hypothetical protein